MTAFPGVDFEVHWKPFQLNPRASTKGVNKLQSYQKRMGEESTEQMVQGMKKLFASEGLGYSIGGLTGNTFDSHRLAEWAKKFGMQKQGEFIAVLFDRYFCREEFLGDHEVLISAATEAGLPGGEARRVLADKEWYADDVRQGLQLSERLQSDGLMSGVPYYLIYPPEGSERKQPYGIPGAQDAVVFEKVLAKTLQVAPKAKI